MKCPHRFAGAVTTHTQAGILTILALLAPVPAIVSSGCCSCGDVDSAAAVALRPELPPELPPQLRSDDGDPVAAALEPFIASGEIAGAVTVVTTMVNNAYRSEDSSILSTVGNADLASKDPMQADTIFWIASMTKPITAAAVLMLADEGKLSIDDPLSKHLPDFAKLVDGAGEPVVVTLRQALTHTSGLEEATREESAAATTLADLVPAWTSRPVKFAPGSKWQYCQSSINAAARVVEVVSGQSFPEFLEARLFGPLGMKDTTFYLSGEQRGRLATSYRRTDAGVLEPAEIGILQGKDPTSRDRYPAANGGLFSTAPDYAKFALMLLGGGTLDGKRYLSEAAITLLSTLQTGELETGFTPGNGWSIGCCVVRNPQGVTASLSPGSFGHGGAYGTQCWIDPVAGRIDILMVQRANFPNADASDVRKAFEAAAAGLGK
jgi:CubicO group peptidase (beta-lactamase class C family)